MIRAADLRYIERKAQRLAQQPIDEMCKVLLKEWGFPAVLNGMAVLIHGQVLLTPLARRLEEEAAKIRHSP